MFEIRLHLFFIIISICHVLTDWETIDEHQQYQPHYQSYNPQLRQHHRHHHHHHDHHPHHHPHQAHHSHTHWTYEDQDHWCDIERTCCGKRQSPIRLNTQTNNVVLVEPFEFLNYGKLKLRPSIANNGHTIAVFFDGSNAQVRGGGLNHTYNLFTLHFHWGSEHVINDIRAPLELHLVHYNSKFENIFSAVKSNEPDALAVLGVFYWVGKHSNPALTAITSKLDKIQFKQNAKKTGLFNLRHLLPTSTNHFYRYDGSLTTPNCSEVVVWTLFMEPNIITAKELIDFHGIKASEINEPEEFLQSNYRATQELFDRKVIIGEEMT